MRLSLFLFLIFVACGRSSSLPPNQLRLSFMADPISLDPRKGGDFISATLHCMIYEGLTRCLSDGSVELAAAERVEISKDETVYTFHLRKTIWSDGYPVTAYDFERAWKTVLDPTFPSLCSYLLFPVKNGEAYAKGEVDVEAVGIRALDEKTLQVELERPTPHFLSLTAFPLLLPVPIHAGGTNGPFVIEQRIAQQEIVLRQNPHYWNREKISLNTIHISILPEETTAWQLFEQGELDWIGGAISPIPPDVMESVRAKLQFYPVAATTFCTFNTQTFPFQNANLRKAFSYAIQREEIAQMGQIPATNCLPPTLCQGTVHQLTDLNLARHHLKLGLEELGIKQLEELTLYFKGGQVDKRLAQTLQKQWKEALGITVKLQELDFKSHMDRLHTRNYQLSIASWIAQIHDPINILERFSNASNPKNFPGWENGDYQTLLTKINQGGEGRATWLSQAEELFIDAMPITPLYHWSNPSLCNPQLEGLTTTPCGGILFDRCKKTINIP